MSQSPLEVKLRVFRHNETPGILKYFLFLSFLYIHKKIVGIVNHVSFLLFKSYDYMYVWEGWIMSKVAIILGLFKRITASTYCPGAHPLSTLLLSEVSS